jgi:hypothetical protein
MWKWINKIAIKLFAGRNPLEIIKILKLPEMKLRGRISLTDDCCTQTHRFSIPLFKSLLFRIVVRNNTIVSHFQSTQLS